MEQKLTLTWEQRKLGDTVAICIDMMDPRTSLVDDFPPEDPGSVESLWGGMEETGTSAAAE